MRSMLRPALLVAALAGPLLAAAPAAAQITDAGTTGTTFATTDFFVGVQFPSGHNLSDFDVARFFNKARCDCDQQVFVYVALTDSGFAKRTTVDQTGGMEVWIGNQCTDPSLTSQRCFRIFSST